MYEPRLFIFQPFARNKLSWAILIVASYVLAEGELTQSYRANNKTNHFPLKPWGQSLLVGRDTEIQILLR